MFKILNIEKKNLFKLFSLIYVLLNFENRAYAYTDTAKLIASSPSADIYLYLGSIKLKNDSTGDYTASGVVNLKENIQGTRSLFNNYSFSCADKNKKEITLLINVGHAEMWAAGNITFHESTYVGKKLQPGSVNSQLFDFVCDSANSSKAPSSTDSAQKKNEDVSDIEREYQKSQQTKALEQERARDKIISAREANEKDFQETLKFHCGGSTYGIFKDRIYSVFGYNARSIAVYIRLYKNTPINSVASNSNLRVVPYTRDGNLFSFQSNYNSTIDIKNLVLYTKYSSGEIGRKTCKVIN